MYHARQPQHVPTTVPLRDRLYERRKQRKRNGWVLVTCPTCKGYKQFISPKSFMATHYTMMSPRFRRQRGARARVEQMRVRAQQGSFPRKIKYAGYKKGELMDANHAIAWYRYDGDPTWHPTYWVWDVDGGSKPTWYVYSPEVDGPWPGEYLGASDGVDAVEESVATVSDG